VDWSGFDGSDNHFYFEFELTILKKGLPLCFVQYWCIWANYN
jgi:hypothetical protein